MKKFLSSAFTVYLSVSSLFADQGVRIGTVEMNGIFVVDDIARVSLVDPVLGVSDWVEVGGRFFDIKVAEVDAVSQSVVLEQGGRRKTLVLKQERIKTLRSGPLVFKRDSDAEIAIDAHQALMFERGQELARSPVRTRLPGD